MPSKPRLILLGLDGATWDVVLPYCEAGRLPTLRRLIEEGAWSVLRSVHPPVTACCWPTLLTGTNPGQHGMFDFFAPQHGTYERRPVTSLDWQQPPLWKLLNDRGLTVGVFNVPVTFPARPVTGYLVSGEMGSPRVDRRMFHPQKIEEVIGPQLRRYEFEPISGSTGRSVRRLVRQMAVRNAAALALAEQMPTDVLIIVLNCVDHAQHFFWDERFEGLRSGPRDSNPLLLAYQAADELLRALESLSGDECTIMVVSDHGAGAVRGYLDFEDMLASLGYLRFTRTALGHATRMRLGRVPLALRPLGAALANRLPNRLRALARTLDGAAAVDYPSSVAFPAGHCGSLRLNVRGREAAGCLSPEEVNPVSDEISRALLDVPGVEDEQLFEVHFARDLYDGPHARLGPDLIAVPQGYSVEIVRATPPGGHWLVSRAEGQVRGLPQYMRAGNHRLEGILVARGPAIQPGHVPPPAALVDVAPTVMSLLGLDVPAHLEGRVLSWAKPGSARRNQSRVMEEVEGRARIP